MPEDRSKLPPSASEYHRIFNCPGFLNLRRALGNPVLPPSDDATRGTRLHTLYAGDMVNSEDEDQVLVNDALRLTRQILEVIGFDPALSVLIVEQRFFLGDTFCGQPDRVYIDGKRAFIPDFKSGWKEVEPAESNLQLRGYITLIAHVYPDIDEIFTAPIQPHVKALPAPARYGREEIIQAKLELYAALEAASKPDAPRQAGSWCDYCPCRANCPEAREAATDIVPTDSRELASNEQLGAFLTRWKLAEGTAAAIIEEIRARISAGQDIPGWTLKPGRTTEKIENGGLVAKRCFDRGMTEDAFNATIEVKKGKLKEALKLTTGKKGAGLEAVLAEVIAGATVETVSQPVLTQVRE